MPDPVNPAHEPLRLPFLGVRVLGLLALCGDLLPIDWLSKGRVVLGNDWAGRVDHVRQLILITESIDVDHLVLDDVVDILSVGSHITAGWALRGCGASEIGF